MAEQSAPTPTSLESPADHATGLELIRTDRLEEVGIETALARNRYAVLDPAATVASDVDRLRSAAAISHRVTVSGYVYDVATGLVETVISAGAAAARNGGA